MSVDSSRVPRFGGASGWLLVAIKPKVDMKNFARSSRSALYKTGPHCGGKTCLIEWLWDLVHKNFRAWRSVETVSLLHHFYDCWTTRWRLHARVHGRWLPVKAAWRPRGLKSSRTPLWYPRISHLIRPNLLTRCGHVNRISQASLVRWSVEPCTVKFLCTLWRSIEGVGVGCTSIFNVVVRWR
jgi:hypothetical protein